ncbi:hypothetical protein HAX54_037246 [Datura stramonium]|uniref:Uncharacterized protein n=1 Tax=Datura stramonium TaxID=4076 RepID=A0ABS8SH94_DATST|nr:hypothetical protein [Datura stramonium]
MPTPVVSEDEVPAPADVSSSSSSEQVPRTKRAGASSKEGTDDFSGLSREARQQILMSQKCVGEKSRGAAVQHGSIAAA